MIRIGDWVYCASIPGTGQVISVYWPWYYPKGLYVIRFQERDYYMYRHEIEK